MINVITIKRKWLLGVPGALLIGALGSGLWEIAFKPAGQWLTKAILTVASLGSSAIKDSIYRQAAKGYHEDSSVNILMLFLAVLCAVPLVPSMYLISLRSRWRKEEKNLVGESTPEQRKSELETVTRTFNILKLLFFLTSLTAVGGYLVIGLEILQANGAYTFFSQSLTICRPYMDEHKAQIIQSRFAQVRNKQDFVSVTKELETVAKSNKLPLPYYNPLVSKVWIVL